VKLLLDSKEAQQALELNLPSPLLAKMEEVSQVWPSADGGQEREEGSYTTHCSC